jgi:hypothetical protein
VTDSPRQSTQSLSWCTSRVSCLIPARPQVSILSTASHGAHQLTWCRIQKSYASIVPSLPERLPLGPEKPPYKMQTK